MKNNAKLIIIGVSITLLVLITIIFMFYFFSSYRNNGNTNINNKEINNDLLEEKKVTLYLFKGKGCSHCNSASEFLKSIIGKYPYLEIQTYEVWYNKNNKELMNKVALALDIEANNSVPLIIIGNTYARRGYADGMQEGIKKEIEESYKNNEYQDIVKSIIANNPDLKVSSESLN